MVDKEFLSLMGFIGFLKPCLMGFLLVGLDRLIYEPIVAIRILNPTEDCINNYKDKGPAIESIMYIDGDHYLRIGPMQLIRLI